MPQIQEKGNHPLFPELPIKYKDGAKPVPVCSKTWEEGRVRSRTNRGWPSCLLSDAFAFYPGGMNGVREISEFY